LWPTTRQHWRAWLEEHHATKQEIWLIYAKKKSTLRGITYSEAVEEALCFDGLVSGSPSRPSRFALFRRLNGTNSTPGTF